jgi:hypothetical protein
MSNGLKENDVLHQEVVFVEDVVLSLLRTQRSYKMSQKAVETKKQPPKLAPELKSLEVLVGDWKEETKFKNDPENSGTGRASFEWMDGGFFLIWRFEAEYKKHGMHKGICVIGYDDISRNCVGQFFDNLGYARTYQVSVKDGVLKIAGDFERFTAKFGEDGKTLTGTWEQSSDGSNWKYLCDVKQTKLK